MGGDEVAPGHANIGIGHRRICQSHRQQRLDLDAYATDRFLDALHGSGIGQPYALMITVLQIVIGQMLFDLRTCAMHQHQSDAKRGQQVEIVRQADEFSVFNYFSAKRDDEGLATKTVDIGRDGTEPGNEIRGSGFDRHLKILTQLLKSPHSVWSADSPAMAAVSVRSTRAPRRMGVKPQSCADSLSARENPPSAPISNIAAP